MINSLLLFEQSVESLVLPVIEEYRDKFFIKNLSLLYQFCRNGDYANDQYTSEIEISILKINEGKVIDYLDHLDVFVVLKGQKNVDPIDLSDKIKQELESILNRC